MNFVFTHRGELSVKSKIVYKMCKHMVYTFNAKKRV